MFEWSLKNKIIAGALAAAICFIAGLFCANIIQPASKTAKIYSAAMKDYADKDFQNAYYLYSKVGFLSKLKPFAIFHQAECAKELGDKKSELKQYKFLFNNYPKSRLAVRAKYLAAQLLVEDEPKEAEKYFKQIIAKAPETDFAIASEYYLGLILYNKYKNEKIFPESVKSDVEMAFRHYLTKAPKGRLAKNAINNWLTLNKEISKDDYLVMANSYYELGEFEHAKEMLANTDLSESWVLDVKNSYAMKNYARAKDMVIFGMQTYAKYSDVKDIYEVSDIYLKITNNNHNDIDYLFKISIPKGKDYIWSSKCYQAPKQYQEGCFNQLYLNFPDSVYGADALANLFFARLDSKDYKNALKIGMDYLNKFKNTVQAPKVMFWMGKIYEKQNNYDEYMSTYKSTIANYPDSYYAYRAYLAMKHAQNPILNAYINEQPVEYPYKNKDDIMIRLAELKDFNMLEFLAEDEFVKSWVYYQKGDYAHSMLIARDAMAKITPKPLRDDLRWRLVYPINYYDEIKHYAENFGNDSAIILALVREESYFNPNAESSAGARGLMQLMPSTAKEISKNYGYGMTSANSLYNPELNIKIGNAYFAQARGMLNNMYVSSIAAYNGGVGSIGSWKRNLNYSDTDDFIEKIPYVETQNYVKKVLRSYWNYLRIYVAGT